MDVSGIPAARSNKPARHDDITLPSMSFDNTRDPVKPRPPAKPAKPFRWMPWLLILLIILIGIAIYREIRSSFYQSLFWHWYGQKLTYQLQNGPNQTAHYPDGPFDQRMGYSQLPQWLPKLQSDGFSIYRQALFSAPLQQYTDLGFYPPYQEKTQTGLHITDCKLDSVYAFSNPQFQFHDFRDIAPLIISTLLFIENRKLLTDPPTANPALDWSRLGAAVVSQLKRAVGKDAAAAGGSTLATQIEKYRHSPQGFTAGVTDKFRQLISASVRAYQPSTNTSLQRADIIQHYLNTVPLAATPQYGEVNGLADGLLAWFGANPFKVSELLQQPSVSKASAAQGLALRQVLSLIIAQRRPSYYLLQGKDDLAQLVNSHLSLLRQQHIISEALYQAAIGQKVVFNTAYVGANNRPFDKTASQLRSRLGQLLGVNMYQLDRLDLQTQNSIHYDLQKKVTTYLQHLNNAQFAEEQGILGARLLTADQSNAIRYSFTLYQSTPYGNKVRVQTDNTDQPFDLNSSSKLELGSTAKLRVMVTYLEIITELYQLYSEEAVEQLRYLYIAPQDALTQWAISYLIANQGVSLPQMLNDALEREYSADPKESFFTGGGLHTFNNFRKQEDYMVPTLRVALQQSINLPFVRLMQDIVSYSIYHSESSSYQLLKDDNDPRRAQYLRQFADKEGATFLRKFWQKYRQKTAAEQLDTFLSGLRQTPERLAAAYLYIVQDSDERTFFQFMHRKLNDRTLTDQQLSSLFRKYQAGKFSLPDQAFIARSHPLELWLLAYLRQHPEATQQQIIADSTALRQEVYQWLFRTQSRSARDTRIRTMLEIEAFWDIHQRWQRLGYPFEHLVPSFATALGSSGDRPSSLAELMGIIINDGKYLPSIRTETLHFASQTPYEVQLGREPATAQQVLAPEITTVIRQLLAEVVNEGTGRRLHPLTGRLPQIGGKTGTGDNRITVVSNRGEMVSSTALNRTATFAFYLGDQHFGVLTAFVDGREAGDYHFTSALPLQVLNGMAPILENYLATPQCQ